MARSHVTRNSLRHEEIARLHNAQRTSAPTPFREVSRRSTSPPFPSCPATSSSSRPCRCTRARCPIPPPTRARFRFTRPPPTASTTRSMEPICSACARSGTSTRASWCVRYLPYRTPIESRRGARASRRRFANPTRSRKTRFRDGGEASPTIARVRFSAKNAIVRDARGN